MEIEYLREFAELAHSLNFSETANKLFISRSALSKHIAILEDELGTELFVRSTHNVYLTDLGKQFLENSAQVLERYDHALEQMQTALEAIGSELRIGFLDAAVRSILIPSVQRFKKGHPDTKLTMTSYELGELERAAGDGTVDIALTILLSNSVVGDEWQFKELYADGLAAMVPLSSPLAYKTSIPYAELLEEELILPRPDCYPVMAELLQKMAADAGYDCKPYAEYTHIDAASIMVETGEAITIVPKHCEVFPHSNSCYIDLEDEEALIRVGALWKATNSNPIIPEFLEELFRVEV